MKTLSLFASPKYVHFYLVVCLLFLSSSVLLAQPGTLDLSFGNAGKVITDFYNSDDKGQTIGIAADGGIVVAGGVNGVTSQPNGNNFGIIKYDQSGKIDSAFGINGKVISGVFPFNPTVSTLIMQPDNKILVAGSGDFTGGVTGNFILIRYLPNGSLDSSFGNNGIIQTFDATSSGIAKAGLLLEDGKIVIAGVTSSSSIADLVLVKYLSNGKYDSTFGINGRDRVSLNIDRGPMAIVQQPDKKFVIATGIAESMAAIRLTPEGALDPSFTGGLGLTGYSLIRSSNFPNGGGSSLFLQTDGKIVIGGILSRGVTPNPGLARLNFTGSIDGAFGNKGLQILESDNLGYGYAITKQADDKIMLGGYTRSANSAYTNFLLLRCTKNGFIDSSFGNNGYVTTSFVNLNDNNAYGLQLQKDQKILLAGYTKPYFGGLADFAIARYNTEASVLAINALSFTATQKQKSIVLSWKATSDVTNGSYILERSEDAIHFSVISIFDGRNSASNQQYSWIDEHALQGTNYYRLVQKNKNGEFIYTNVIKVEFEQLFAATISPNPTENTLFINGLNNGLMCTYTIVDNEGRIIKKVGGVINQHELNISFLSPGLYYLNIKQNNKSVQYKFIKR